MARKQPAGQKFSSAVYLALALLLIFSSVLAACTSGPSVPATAEPTPEEVSQVVQTSGKVLYMINPQAPDTLNPHLSSSLKDVEAARITYEPLASFDKNLNLVPFLAAEIPSYENGDIAADNKSVTWKLKQGVKWSDGQPFTADDVLFTYQFISNPDVNAGSAYYYWNVDKVEVIDPYTVKVSYKEATTSWYSAFVGRWGAILPKHVFEAYNGKNASEAPANTLPVGTGPYRVMPPGIKPQEILLLGTQLVKTNKIVFEPNPYFREPDKLAFSRIELRGGGTPDEAARRVLQSGDIDFAYGLDQLPAADLEKLANGAKGRLVTDFGTAVYRIMVNHTDPNTESKDGERSSLLTPHPFMSDLKVRQAFAHAIDRQALAAIFGPGGLPTYNNLVIPPDYKYDTQPSQVYDFDLEKAKALLDEAGWKDTNGDGIRDKNGVKMKVVFQTTVGDTLVEAQKIVKDDLEKIGVEVEQKIIDPSIMFSAGSQNPDSDVRFNADLIYEYFLSISPDPSSYMSFWTCGQIPQKSNNWEAGLNIERWCKPEYDKLYQQAVSEPDPQKRVQMFAQLNDMLVTDVAMIPTVYFGSVQGVSNSLEGIDFTPWDSNTWNIQDWRLTQ